jgi:type IV secretory pathway VirB3-like protein
VLGVVTLLVREVLLLIVACFVYFVYRSGSSNDESEFTDEALT